MKERPVTRIEVLALESGAHGLPPHVQLKVTWIPSETQHIMALRPGDTATVNAQSCTVPSSWTQRGKDTSGCGQSQESTTWACPSSESRPPPTTMDRSGRRCRAMSVRYEPWFGPGHMGGHGSARLTLNRGSGGRRTPLGAPKAGARAPILGGGMRHPTLHNSHYA